MSSHIEIDGTITKSRYHNGLMEMVIDGRIHSLDLWNMKHCRILAGLLEGMRIKAEAPIDHDGIVGDFVSAERVERYWGPPLVVNLPEPIRIISVITDASGTVCHIKQILNNEERIVRWYPGVDAIPGGRYDVVIDADCRVLIARKIDGYRPIHDQAQGLRENGK